MLRAVAPFIIGALCLIAVGWVIGLNIRSRSQSSDSPASSGERVSSGDLTDLSALPVYEPDVETATRRCASLHSSIG